MRRGIDLVLGAALAAVVLGAVPAAAENPEVLSPQAVVAFEEALVAVLRGEADERWLALARLRDMPLPDGELALCRKVFEGALSDSDGRVRSFATFALNGGLAGRPESLAQIYIGPAPAPSPPGAQPAAPAETPDSSLPAGRWTGAGVFVGSAGAALEAAGEQPP